MHAADHEAERIPVGEVSDSSFGEFQEAVDAQQAEKARALRHYSAMAAEAARLMRPRPAPRGGVDIEVA